MDPNDLLKRLLSQARHHTSHAEELERFSLMSGAWRREQAATVQEAHDRIVDLERNEADLCASSADDIRARGWMVAVHNDYKQDGATYTFWLFTKDGRAIKGEGCTDAEALDQVRAQLDGISLSNCAQCGEFREHGHECKTEAAPPKCPACGGSGSRMLAVGILDDTTYRKCDDCGGSGKVSP